jgi:hypothetical protein
MLEAPTIIEEDFSEDDEEDPIVYGTAFAL